MRSMELARALSSHCEVRLFSLGGSSSPKLGISIFAGGKSELRGHVDWAEVVLYQGYVLALHPWIYSRKKIMVVDMYDPFHLEQLVDQVSSDKDNSAHELTNAVATITDSLRKSDFIICASEKQRDYWLGHLGAVGRLNASVYSQDPSLRKLIDVVPFGISNIDPEQHFHGIRGAVKGISEADKVIVWGGGIYNWFDPLTLIRAIASISVRRPEVKLFFMGGAHPDPSIQTFSMAIAARELSDELNLTGKHIFFHEGWVPFEQRSNYLLDANLGISTHLDHLETRFSFRTRILDYLWSCLPIVSTAGDTFASLIEDKKLGLTVPPEDVDALVDAIEKLLWDDVFAEGIVANIRQYRGNYVWHEIAGPLIDFCLAGSRAADLAVSPHKIPVRIRRETWLGGKIRGMRLRYKTGGIRSVVRRLFGIE